MASQKVERVSSDENLSASCSCNVQRHVYNQGCLAIVIMVITFPTHISRTASPGLISSISIKEKHLVEIEFFFGL